ncbi:MAG: MBL fold metallo-hydrolase [DPANN group archaeon]|nr:MBL fold metallo-hydrolase [DPANN group archaeon]
MGIEIMPIGGHSEIGKNCTGVKVDDEIVILDMGLHMEHYINHTDSTDSDDLVDMSPKTLIDVDAAPDVRILGDLKKKVVAICISHAHLDHVGAVPFLSNKFDCPIYSTPFTIELLRTIIKDEKIDLKNELVKQKENSRFKISKNIEIEFIKVTHSTPQTVMIAVHTKYGTILYVNDMKLDDHPMLGKKTNIKRLKELKVKILILNCLYSTTPGKTPSEKVPEEMLKEILLNTDTKRKNIFVTTFSSQIARIKTVRNIAKKIGRKVIFLGRSLAKYSFAAEKAEITKLSNVKIVKFSSKVKKFLSRLDNTEKYLFIVTGNQGEPKSTLSKIVYNNYFHFKPKDIVIFSCTVIPVPGNSENREKLEAALKQKHVSIYKDVHASGHARLEDHRTFLNMTNPEHLIPVHGDKLRAEAMKKMAIEEGLKEKNIHILKNGQRIEIS